MKVIDYELLSKYIYEEGYTVTELARMTNISRSTIDNILSGKNYPSYTITSILAETLEMTGNKFVEIFFPALEFIEEPES